jgi:hypothetical protein
MNSEAHQKVQAEHLSRNAFLYVRQSTLRQVREKVESSQRQYGLRDRALALGWPLEQIVVIDCDQGQSGGSAVEAGRISAACDRGQHEPCRNCDWIRSFTAGT